jgi:hypothetical protein
VKIKGKMKERMKGKRKKRKNLMWVEIWWGRRGKN